MKGIELQLTKHIIRDKSFNSVDQAIKIIKAFGSQDRFIVVGATDSRGSAIFNKNLSQSRAELSENILLIKEFRRAYLLQKEEEKRT